MPADVLRAQIKAACADEQAAITRGEAAEGGRHMLCIAPFASAPGTQAHTLEGDGTYPNWRALLPAPGAREATPGAALIDPKLSARVAKAFESLPGKPAAAVYTRGPKEAAIIAPLVGDGWQAAVGYDVYGLVMPMRSGQPGGAVVAPPVPGWLAAQS